MPSRRVGFPSSKRSAKRWFEAAARTSPEQAWRTKGCPESSDAINELTATDKNGLGIKIQQSLTAGDVEHIVLLSGAKPNQRLKLSITPSGHELYQLAGVSHPTPQQIDRFIDVVARAGELTTVVRSGAVAVARGAPVFGRG